MWSRCSPAVLLLGERLPAAQLPMYAGIFAAVGILVIEGASRLLKERKRPAPLDR